MFTEIIAPQQGRTTSSSRGLLVSFKSLRSIPRKLTWPFVTDKKTVPRPRIKLEDAMMHCDNAMAHR